MNIAQKKKAQELFAKMDKLSDSYEAVYSEWIDQFSCSELYGGYLKSLSSERRVDSELKDFEDYLNRIEEQVKDDEDLEESRLRRGRMLKESIDKKYELTDETEELKGEWGEKYTFYRIRALKNFGNVNKGDLGGWVESEENLSQEGDCWVYDNARVGARARVYDNAKVYGNAEVRGYAQVYGNAKVFENAVVYGNAHVFDDSCVYGNAKVADDAFVCRHANVYGNAKVFGDATVWGRAKVDYFVYEGEITESCQRRGRMLKESDSGCVRPVYIEVYDYNTETGEDETDIEIPEEIEDELLRSSYGSVKEMAADIAKKLDGWDGFDTKDYEVMEKDDDSEILVSYETEFDWERNVIVQYKAC